MKKIKKVKTVGKLISKSRKSKTKSASSKMKRKNSKLKIAHMHWGYPPIIGGVETHLSTIMPTMVKMGHEVSLLTGSVEGHKVRYMDRDVSIFRTPIMDLNWLYKRGLVGLDREVREVFKNFLDETKPDIVHTHNMHYFSKIHAKAIEETCKAKGIPLILTAHNVWDEVLYLDLIRNIKWNHIIAVSHYIRKEIIGAGCDDSLVTTVHHGVDTNRFKPGIDKRSIYKTYPKMRNRPVIFHPARMGIAKGCDVSIKAFNIVRKTFPDALLVLAGTKNIIDWGSTQQRDIAYFVNLIRHFGLQNNVLVDSYSLKRMPSMYAASDVVIYPSTAMEPFGLTMLEAMATGKPMIVTRAGGMPEIVSDGINGFVVPIKDFDELAGVIIRLLADPTLAKRLGNTGMKMINSYYTMEDVTKNTIEIYRGVLR